MSTTTTAVDHSEHIVLLQRVLHIIETQPERWRQNVWASGFGPNVFDEAVGHMVLDENACGTSFCFAGWVAHLDPQVRWVSGDDVIPVRSGSDVISGSTDISVYARKKLGLAADEGMLFSASNSLDDLRGHVKDITARMLEEMYPPPPPPPLKRYVVTISTTRTKERAYLVESEEEALAQAKSAYPEVDGRTYAVAEDTLPPVDEVDKGDWVYGFTSPESSVTRGDRYEGEVTDPANWTSGEHGDALRLRDADGIERSVWRSTCRKTQRPFKVGDWVSASNFHEDYHRYTEEGRRTGELIRFDGDTSRDSVCEIRSATGDTWTLFSDTLRHEVKPVDEPAPSFD